jgi:hypothetical protein
MKSSIHDFVIVSAGSAGCEVVTDRGNALLDALPDEPINRARADSIRWILSNPIRPRDLVK